VCCWYLLAVITYLDRVCISVAGPRIQEYLHIGPRQWGWVVGAFAIAYAVFEFPGGWMADRFGPRLVLTRIVLWWSAFTALTGAVSSLPLLLLTRFAFARLLMAGVLAVGALVWLKIDPTRRLVPEATLQPAGPRAIPQTEVL
jgi:MFS family permease